MNRRRAISALAGGCCAAASRSLDGVVLVDVASGRILLETSVGAASPGSTMKPLALAALIHRGKLRGDESVACPGQLRIANRNFNCSHPPMDVPMRADAAIAYSCNYFVAKVAERFAPGELSRELQRFGIAARAADTKDSQRLQALGEFGIHLTARDLALGYRRFAADLGRPAMEPVVAGMEAAVEFGTAQHARVAGVKVAGKTGSSVQAGVRVAWFAGMMPSRNPEVVVAVMLPGKSGGSDAAPVAAQALEAYRGKRL